MTTLENPVTTDSRLAAIVDDVVEALCGVIRAHGVTFEEYRTATDWLIGAGRQEFQIPLLLDLFLSTTVDDLGASADGGTESNVEGPFYLPDMPMLEPPYVLPRREDEPGEVLVFSGSVMSTDGTPLAGALVDVWQDNGAGEYSHFHPGVPENNLRGRLVTDADGRFELETILPVPYEVPTDGAVGVLLAALGQSAFRPAHVHFKVSHETAQPLTTQIYFAGDPWLEDDVVVGAVKPELVTSVVWSADESEGDSRATCSYDFMLPPTA
jgi:catechol 1,2-dioxygenase